MNDKVSLKDRQRLITAFCIVVGIIFLLCVRVGYVQIVKKDEYTKKALLQQTKDEVIDARRGEIIDRNNQKLAVSTINYSVWIRPSVITKGKKAQEAEGAIGDTIRQLAEAMNVKEGELLKKLDKKNPLIKIARGQNNETVEKIRKLNLQGVQITQETKRAYPMKNFASQLLGSVTDDNNGLSGLEEYYHGVLRGNAGREVKSKDASGKNLSYGDQY